MGLFDLFKKKPPQAVPAPAEEGEAPAHGWDAIDRVFRELYPGQTDPVHRAPLVYRMHDISENAAAFDGISAYDGGEYWHFVTYGLTELYDKYSEVVEVSGLGYEFTFKLPKVSDKPPPWAFDFLEAIGKAAWKGENFAAGHVIKTGPLDGRPSTRENAVLILTDPSFPDPIETPNGRFELLLMIGVEDEYRQRVLAAHARDDSNEKSSIYAELRALNPKLVTPIRTEGNFGAA
jgi:hypothetical protein